MSNLKKRIEKWLENPRKYLSAPSVPKSGGFIQDGKDLCLKLKDLACVRKNESSDDEIVILGFWLLEKNDDVITDGIIHLGNDFSEEGEIFSMNLSIPLVSNVDRAAFCFMVYEEDAPILLDPHDPIGLVVFHQNFTVSVYKGDFREISQPLEYALNISNANEIELDAGSDGCYRLSYGVQEI